MQNLNQIDSELDTILITGAGGFIGARVVDCLLEYGYKNLKCFVRPSSNIERLKSVLEARQAQYVKVIQGNLLSHSDCTEAVRNVSIVFHLAAGVDKSFAGAFLNSVVTTRNLLDALVEEGHLKRFVNVSSFAVYSNMRMPKGALLDESCEVEYPPYRRGEAYCYGKIKQDQIVMEYGRTHNLPYTIVRPGAVYGPGKIGLTGRVGVGTFGLFLHLGGLIPLPLSYVDNCAEAIVLAGITNGINGEVFNIVDDDLPSSRQFLKLFKQHVSNFPSLSLPYWLTYMLCYMWEKYAEWSKGQIPPVFNRSRCSAEWKGNQYSNAKLKTMLGWMPRVSFIDASQSYFNYQKTGRRVQ
jgi:nucleoside-diphosphate-sugar epimerase